MKNRIWVGCTHTKWTVFKSAETPTSDSHGKQFYGVIGPFRTMRGANFMALYGQGNPYCQTVADAERIAKQQNLPSGRMRRI